MPENDWSPVSTHGAIIIFIVKNPDCTIKDIAEAMSLTRRTVWGIIGRLRRAGMLHIRKEGRRHFYTVNLDAPFKHPTIDTGATLGVVFGGLVPEYSQRPPKD